MAQRSRNVQMFALRHSPPETVTVAGAVYRLVRVFKHDFYAATCLYEATGPAEVPKIVVKFGRENDFCGLPLDWLGRWNRSREQSIYRALEGVVGIPRWMGRLGELGYAIEYIESRPLDHQPPPPPGFFDALHDLFKTVHARGVAYCDSNKRSNILVGVDDRPYLIDFQISFRYGDDLPWPIRPIVRTAFHYMCGKDIYHLFKHKRRISPDELRPEEEALSRRRTGLHLVHRKIAKGYRAIRRRFLRTQHQKGQLVSPTAELEDHFQPEKGTWRKS
jgi:hypothetical protein